MAKRILGILLLALPICTYAATAEELARQAQDPLANISAISFDNDFNFNMGNQKKTGYSLQLQPVYAFDFKNFIFIPRALIPIIAAPSESEFPRLGQVRPRSSSTRWGLSDIATQFFFVPKTGGSWKFGVGPQVSWRTRTDTAVAGPGWGGGPVAVATGELGQWSLAGIVGHMWGNSNGFSTTIIQPMIFYNVSSMPGVAVGYNNIISYDYKASSGNRWNVPLGAMVGKTFLLSGGYGLDVSLGAYHIIQRPTGAADHQIKLTFFLIIPRS